MSTYQPWPIGEQSYDIASTTVVLAATTLTALAARLYVLLQRKGELPVLASTVSICSAHAFMLGQSACIVVACYYGWGITIQSLPERNIQIAETSFFTSNVLLILVLGCSRISTAITLWRACHSTSSAKLAIAVFPAIVLWTLGSILGLVIRRAVDGTFWQPVGADCSFTLWAAVSLTGLAIDLCITFCAASVVAPLQMGRTKRIYTLVVFAVGILVIVPNAWGLSVLRAREQQIARDPTLASIPFIYANQAAIAVALWSRALETASKLKQDMGYVSYGLSTFSPSAYFRSGPSNYASGSKQRHNLKFSRPRNSAVKYPMSEDEVRLRPDGTLNMISNEARQEVHVEAAQRRDNHNMNGIDVRRDFDWSVESANSEGHRTL